MVEVDLLRRVGVGGVGKNDCRRDDVLLPEARIDREQSDQTAPEEERSRHQNDGECDLPNHEAVAETARAAGSAARGVF